MGCLSSTLLYSETGDGKTAAVGSFAKWIRLRTGKKLRLYTAEPDIGTIEHLVGEYIEPIFVRDRPNASETLAMASQGWGPDASGVWKPPTKSTWDEIGGCAYEGGTEFGNWLLEEFRALGAAGSIVSAEKAPAQYTSGAMKLAGNNQTHYGMAQGRLKEYINASQKLPGHQIWTCRMLKTLDKEQDPSSFEKQYTYGPLLAGKAATPDVPAWFGNCIHIDMVKTGIDAQKNDIMERRAYLRKHYDAGSTIPYPAKLRVPPEFESEVPTYMKLTADLNGMITIFDMIEALREKARTASIKQL